MKSLRKLSNDAMGTAPVLGSLVVDPAPREAISNYGVGSRDPSIVITDIRDQENNMLPGPVIESVARPVLEAIADLGLKATVTTLDRPSANLVEIRRAHH